MQTGPVYTKKGRPVFIKTLISYILVFIIPLLLISAFSYKLTTDTVKEKTNETYTTSLKSLKNEFDSNFDSLNKFSVELSQVAWIKKLSHSKNDVTDMYMSDPISFQYYISELCTYVAMNGFIKDIAVYFNDKNTIMSTQGKYEPGNFFLDAYNFADMDEAMWQKILSEYNLSKLLLPSNVKSYGSPYRLLTYIQSLPPGDKNFKSTVIIFINEEVINKLIKNSLNIESYSLFILNSNNDVITGFNTDSILLDVIRQKEYGSGDTITIEDKKFPQKGNYRLFYSTSPVNNWKYVIAVPINKVMGRTNNLIYLNILFSLASVIIGLILSYKLTSYSYKPIYYLVDFVQKVYHEHSKQESNEYAFLQNALNTMVKHKVKTDSEINVYKPLAKDAYLIKLLAGDIGSTNLAMVQNMLNISFVHNNFTCVHILLASDYSLTEEVQSDIRAKLSLRNSYSFFVELDSKNKIIILNTPDEQNIIKALISNIESYLDDISAGFKAIGIGRTYQEVCDLYKSYDEATTSLDYKFVMSSNRVFYFENINTGNESTYYCPFEQEEFIINHVKSGSYSNAIKLIKNILSENLSKKILSSSTVKYLCFHIASVIIKVLEDTGIPVPENISLNDIFKLDTVGAAEKYLDEIYLQVCQIINDEKESGNSKLLKELISYINDNYKDSSLSLTSLADKFDVSPTYLSRFIKNQIGYNFSNYLNKKRIEASKPLLIKNDTII